MTKKSILLTGATGYVGGRLLPILTSSGYSVRCLARRPEYLQPRVRENVHIVRGDILDKSSLIQAMQGIDAAYYLVHSMGAAHDFEEIDRIAAQNFAQTARECSIERIIYLGGLGDSNLELSRHLRSRQEVGRLLSKSNIPVIELRASIILGSGSISFELVRALVERLPVMVTPRWVSVKAQPIAIGDLLEYLNQALEIEAKDYQIYEIGGKDQVSYGEIMQEYARQRGLRRLMIPVPVLTPRLSSLWLGLVTPIYARIGRKLIDGVRYPTIVQDDSALKVFSVHPRGVSEAISEALCNEEREFAETHWYDAVSAAGIERNWGGVRFGNRLVDQRTAEVETSVEKAFKPIQEIGGQTGWYYGKWLWHLRGFIDLLVGGVGIRRGRQHPTKLYVGDTIDFWRVESYQPEQKLGLISEMKIPGRAWLEFEVKSKGSTSIITQTAIFDPVGLFGLLYWYVLYPFHNLVFKGMLRNIVKSVQKRRESKA